jgi:hypothetical protein
MYCFFSPEHFAQFNNVATPETYEELQALEEANGSTSTMFATGNSQEVALLAHNECDREIRYFGPSGVVGYIEAHRTDYDTLEEARKDGASYILSESISTHDEAKINATKMTAQMTAKMLGQDNPILYFVEDGKVLHKI